jgi:hypothetical protein
MDELETEHLSDRFHTVRTSLTAWVLFALALLGGIGASAFLWMRVESARLQTEAATEALARAKIAHAELAQRLDRAESDRVQLVAAREALSAQLAAKDDELRVLAARAGAAAAEAAAAARTAAKKKPAAKPATPAKGSSTTRSTATTSRKDVKAAKPRP